MEVHSSQLSQSTNLLPIHPSNKPGGLDPPPLDSCSSPAAPQHMIYCSITPCMSSQAKSREALTIFSKLVFHFIFARALEAKMCECSPPGLMLGNPGIYLFWLSAKHANAGPESRRRKESERGKKKYMCKGSGRVVMVRKKASCLRSFPLRKWIFVKSLIGSRSFGGAPVALQCDSLFFCDAPECASALSI